MKIKIVAGLSLCAEDVSNPQSCNEFLRGSFEKMTNVENTPLISYRIAMDAVEATAKITVELGVIAARIILAMATNPVEHSLKDVAATYAKTLLEDLEEYCQIFFELKTLEAKIS